MTLPPGPAGVRQIARSVYAWGTSAFTLVELLVVIAVVALLSLTLLPALARTKADSRSFQCLNNIRELNRAWRMWSDDNQDLLLYAAELPNNPAASARAWVTGFMDFNPANTSNWDIKPTIVQSPLWTYCGTNADVWRCPSDESVVIVNGVAKPRVRSYAMNVYLGGWGGTDGGWGWAAQYRLYQKFSDIAAQPPSLLFVFTDTRPDYLGDGEFFILMDGYSPRIPTQYRFAALPAAYHDGGAVFSYGDGHGEVHRWQDRRTTPPVIYYSTAIQDGNPSPRNADIAWLQERATRPK